MPDWLFYRTAPSGAGEFPALAGGYSAETWHPTLFRIVPSGFPILPFAAWWLFHTLRVFSNRDFGILLIRYQGSVVHRSVITPAYFRFPFMSKIDLQVGDTWTHPNHRGKGLATIALRIILSRPSPPERRFWYVVEADNKASIRVVEKAGFQMAGKGDRTTRLGLGLLGAYRFAQQCQCQPAILRPGDHPSSRARSV